jgi:hypothetical protein
MATVNKADIKTIAKKKWLKVIPIRVLSVD